MDAVERESHAAELRYEPLEYVSISKPCHRIEYLVNACRGKRVLDLGCWDETALSKKESSFWLHRRIADASSYTIGLDNSPSLPPDDYLASNSRIIKGDVTNKDDLGGLYGENIDVIVAGELIEHLPNTLQFFQTLKEIYPGKRLICSTPNATNLSNILLAIARRESTHHDHLSIYSYKTLSTLAGKAFFAESSVHPYYTSYPEMILRNRGLARLLILAIQKSVNLVEHLNPLWAGGLILDATL